VEGKASASQAIPITVSFTQVSVQIHRLIPAIQTISILLLLYMSITTEQAKQIIQSAGFHVFTLLNNFDHSSRLMVFAARFTGLMGTCISAQLSFLFALVASTQMNI
jgi:hypothetical protein